MDIANIDLELAFGMRSVLFCSMVCDRAQRLAVVGYNLSDCECFTQLQHSRNILLYNEHNPAGYDCLYRKEMIYLWGRLRSLFFM